jgi:hypothetical protein
MHSIQFFFRRLPLLAPLKNSKSQLTKSEEMRRNRSNFFHSHYQCSSVAASSSKKEGKKGRKKCGKCGKHLGQERDALSSVNMEGDLGEAGVYSGTWWFLAAAGAGGWRYGG